MVIELKYIDRIINRQNEFMKWRTIHALFIFLVGVSLLIMTYFADLDFGESSKTLAGIGSTLVLSISAWPIKEVIEKRNSIKIFKAFKLDINELEADDPPHEEELGRIKTFVWQAVEKLALS